MSGTVSLQQLFEQAVTEIGRGNLAQAEAMLSRLLHEAPNHPDLLQLMGIVHGRAGRPTDAIKHFRASLAQHEKQPHVHNHLASALKASGNYSEAEQHYRRALALNPNFADAQYNLALLLLDIKPSEAKGLLAAVTEANPANANAFDALGLALGKLGDNAGAIASAERACGLAPTSTTAWHNLGGAAMAMLEYKRAEHAYSAAVRLRPTSDTSWVGLGNALRCQERNEDAKQAYAHAVDANPSNIDAHRLFNEMLWQTGETHRYLTSFPTAIAARPTDGSLRVAYANELLRVGEASEALRQLEAAPKENAAAQDAAARASTMIGDVERALEHHRTAIEHAPGVALFRQNFVQALLKASRHAEALDNSTSALNRFPLDQGILAMHTTALQILGDARHRWLSDFSTIAKVYRVDPPEGFPDVAAFNAALAERLRAMHSTKNHPTDQTLRGGTQTFGALFQRTDPLIDQLRLQLEKVISRCIAEMPDDATHPFFSRKSNKFAFSGSWSVRLREGGFHTNHVHPEGWISSAYYVNIPPETRKADGNAGWFKMGETSLELGPHEKIGRLVQPEVGTLILFPSYFWHGTVPFQSTSERLTVAFDVVPV